MGTMSITISFDVGGTLIDYMPDNGILKELFDICRCEYKYLEERYKMHFTTRQISFYQFCSDVGLSTELVIEILDMYYSAKEKCHVFDDAIYILEYLKKSNIASITVSNSSYRNPFTLEAYGLDGYFEEQIHSYETGYAKPMPEIYKYAEKKINTKKDRLIHIGDSYVSDYLGAKKAGWGSILLLRKNQTRYSNHNVISTLYQIERIVEEGQLVV